MANANINSKTEEQLFPSGEMSKKMLNMLQTMERLEEGMSPVLSKPYHELFSKLNPLNRAKMGLMEAYVINSLFWVLTKTSGENDTSLKEEYKMEMNRLKELQSRITEIERRAERPKTKVSVAARLIQRGLGKSAREEDSEEDSECSTFLAKKKPRAYENESEDFRKAWQ